MIAVIQLFHNGMSACVQPHDGVCLDRFEQGLRQGCVLSPLLTNNLFAVVLTAVLQRFSEDMVILGELAPLKEPPTSIGPEPAMNYVRGMLYANDACILSRSSQGLAKMMKVIVEVCRAFFFTMSATTAETIRMSPLHKPRTMVQVEATGPIYKHVQYFTYLEGARTETPDMSKLFIKLPYCLKKNLNASRPSEHPQVRGENVKTFRWDHRLQIQNLFTAFKRVPRW